MNEKEAKLDLHININFIKAVFVSIIMYSHNLYLDSQLWFVSLDRRYYSTLSDRTIVRKWLESQFYN